MQCERFHSARPGSVHSARLLSTFSQASQYIEPGLSVHSARPLSTFSRASQYIDDLQNYCLGTRRGIAADRGRPAVGFVYIPNGKLVHFIVHFIFSLWPFSS